MTNKPTKANKGEWSEFYTLLKLLAEQKLYAADEHLEKLKDIFYPVLKVITAKNSDREISFELDDGEDIKVFNPRTASITSVKRLVIKERIGRIFSAIKTANVSTFEIPLADEILEKLQKPVIKGYSHRKSDIVLVIHDVRTGIKPEVGFSIKSQVGGASTLLNPGTTTNFIFEINNFNSTAEKINGIETRAKLRDRLKAIYDSGASLKFAGMESGIFEENLIKMDSLLPDLIAEMVRIHYTGVASRITDINNELEKSGYNLVPGHASQKGFYEFKIKHFLMNTALGMTPGRKWDGLLEVHGGYIIVREDGEIVCYHIYNQDAFREYLYVNTRLETPSSSRYGYGSVYEQNGKHFIKLNLQIRFTD
ncbi:MAG: Type II restriction endonuclease HpaII [Microgenomates group bacterium Gr01-1014_7]|nr:MAG: Type II restriction endonuclease HpaII [Microgenomates group bacterium Gr01-1014_7]